MSKHDPIDPGYYTSQTIEPIVVIEAWNLNFHLGSAIKYIARRDSKGTRRDDLIKAANYLYREATGKWLPKELLDDQGVQIRQEVQEQPGCPPGPSEGSEESS